MALTRTTLSSAVAVDDTSISVASATGFAAGSIIKVDQEVMVVQLNYLTGTTIPVRRGQNGTATAAHVTTAGVVVGTAALDYADPAIATVVNFPPAGRARIIVSVTATSTLTLGTPGSDLTVVLNGTAAITLTVPVPTADMDGDEMTIVGNGAAAHVLTFTGGLSGAGTSYDVITVNATAPAAIKLVACNKLWLIYAGPAIGGTVTNLIGSVA